MPKQRRENRRKRIFFREDEWEFHNAGNGIVGDHDDLEIGEKFEKGGKGFSGNCRECIEKGIDSYEFMDGGEENDAD